MITLNRVRLAGFEVYAPEPRQECQNVWNMSVRFTAEFLIPSAAQGVPRQSHKEGNEQSPRSKSCFRTAGLTHSRVHRWVSRLRAET